jgi:hypothetical protein
LKVEDNLTRRIIGLIVAAAVVSYAGFQLIKATVPSQEPEIPPIAVTDRIDAEANTHYLRGAVPVPTPCHRLTVKVSEEPRYHYHLDFLTWQEPSRDCKEAPTYDSFTATVFGPALGVRFAASLDGKPLDMEITKVFVER